MTKKTKDIVLARTKIASDKGLELDGKKYEFRDGKAMWVSDPGVAQALQQKYPRDVAVTQDQQYTWHVNNDGGNGTRMDNIHRYTFQGVDTSHLKETRDNGYVWVKDGYKQRRMKRSEALAEGYEIVPLKRSRRAVKRQQEAQNESTI